MRAQTLTLCIAFALSALGGSAFAEAAYCPDLLRLTDLARTKNKFAYIAGPPREGNFRDTTMPLAGWHDCSLYGFRTYTCDSSAFATAEKALAATVAEVTDCLGDDWSKDESRSSPVYVVVRNGRGPVSITLNTDTADDGRHLVRLSLFLRGS